jgi:hypothetical protein
MHHSSFTLLLLVGPCVQDSRSSSPARSPKGLQTTFSAPAAVLGTDLDDAPGAAATHEQLEPAADVTTTAAAVNGADTNGAATAATNGAATTAGAAGARPAVKWQDQLSPQQQLESQLAATNGTTNDSSSTTAATNGLNGSRPLPPVPPLAPGTVPLRTSSAGSNAGSNCSSRRQSLLSDACRASSRTFLQQPAELAAQDPPARPSVTQLPLHLLTGSSDSSAPPSVAMQQVGRT